MCPVESGIKQLNLIEYSLRQTTLNRRGTLTLSMLSESTMRRRLGVMGRCSPSMMVSPALTMTRGAVVLDGRTATCNVMG